MVTTMVAGVWGMEETGTMVHQTHSQMSMMGTRTTAAFLTPHLLGGTPHHMTITMAQVIFGHVCICGMVGSIWSSRRSWCGGASGALCPVDCSV